MFMKLSLEPETQAEEIVRLRLEIQHISEQCRIAHVMVENWKALAVLVHPDRWNSAPAGIKELSHEAMIWLLDHRPSDAERN
jgi:hypothetical protein